MYMYVQGDTDLTSRRGLYPTYQKQNIVEKYLCIIYLYNHLFDNSIYININIINIHSEGSFFINLERFSLLPYHSYCTHNYLYTSSIISTQFTLSNSNNIY